MTVAVIGAPPGFAHVLGELPEGAKLRAGARGKPALVIWFVGSAPELGWEIRRISAFASGAPLWIAWRKKAARKGPGAGRRGENAAGPSESAVREVGLAAGLVDYKVCAIDAEWSGLLFARRSEEAFRERLLELQREPRR